MTNLSHIYIPLLFFLLFTEPYQVTAQHTKRLCNQVIQKEVSSGLRLKAYDQLSDLDILSLDSIAFQVLFQRYASLTRETGNTEWNLRAQGIKVYLEYQLGKYSDAELYSMQAIEECQLRGDTCATGGYFLTLAMLCGQLGKSDSAYYYFAKSEDYAKGCSKQFLLSKLYLELGKLYEKDGEMNQAFSRYEIAYALAEIEQDREVLKETSQYLASIFEQQGEVEKALSLYKIFLANYDSLYNAERPGQLLNKEVAYANDKSDQENRVQEQIQRAEQSQKLHTQKWLAISFSGGFLLSLIIALISYRNYKHKQRVNKQLSQQNREIEEQKDRLLELDRFKSHFFTNIVHELRTPLTLISSPLQSLMDDKSISISSSIQNTHDLVLRNARKLTELVNDIMDISKVESSNLILLQEPVDIGSLMKRIASNYGSMASQLKINYKVSVEELHKVILLIDLKRTEKIMNNLIFNAIKYTPSGGEIELVAYGQGDYLMVEIKDTGQGIAESDLPHVFNRYYQSKQPNVRLQGGTGLGLALAKELSVLMGGDLTVESKLHVGSKFTLQLPWQESNGFTSVPEIEEKYESTCEEVVVPVSSPISSKSILIVEDNTDMQAFLNQLISAKYKSHLAFNGRQALDLLKHRTVDLIITDAMMPEMDGYELLMELKKDEAYRYIPVIMLTALDFESKKLEALSIGVDDFLAKPFSPQEVLVRISNLLARSEVKKRILNADPEEQDPEDNADDYNADLAWIKEVGEVIERTLESGDFSIASLSDQFHMTLRTFQRRIKRVTGLTPRQYHHEIALQKAKKLLERGIYSNQSGVAMAVGFSHVSRFSSLYMDRFGKKPSAYFDYQST